MLVLTILLALLQASWLEAADYIASSGGSAAAGSDSNNCTSISTPCLTFEGALAKAIAVHGHNGAGHFVTLRGGSYNMTASAGLKSGNNTLILSGSSWGSPFTIRAYNASSPGTVCDPIGPHAFGDSACEPVELIRDMNPGSKTLAEMQSIGGLHCNGLPCVGAPTLAECIARHPPFGTAYPTQCWAGAGNDYSFDDIHAYLYLIQDRSGGQVLLEGVVETYGLADSSTINTIKYVVWDGISCDARGVVASCFRSSQWWNHELSATFMIWKNGYWRNSTHSMMGQPGIANGVGDGKHGVGDAGIAFEYFLSPRPPVGGPYVQGPRITNDFTWQNFKITGSGIPFDTLCADGVTFTPGCVLARERDMAKYLHAMYFHAGGNHADGVEVSHTAGFFFTPESPDNSIRNSYIHHNVGGAQVFGIDYQIENNVFYNNNQDLSFGDINVTVTSGNEQVIRNNTFIRGPRNTYGVSMQFDVDSYSMIINNNILHGYPIAIAGQPCHTDPDPNKFPGPYRCFYTARITIQSNLIYPASGGVAFSIPGIDNQGELNASPDLVAKPKCAAGSTDLTTCNIGPWSAAFDPLFASTTAPNFTLQSGSPAVNAGFNNGLTTDFLGNTRANGLSTGSGIDIGAIEYCNPALGACNTASKTATITVQSGGASGVNITWGSGCINPSLASSQSTSFNLVCDLDSTLTFVAPSTASGNNLAGWLGCSSTTTTNCTVTSLSGGRTLTATYEEPPPEGEATCGTEKIFAIGNVVQICSGQTIVIWDNYTIEGQNIGTHTAGDQGVVIGGPGDFEGTPYYNVNFTTSPDGWLTTNNMFLVSAGSGGGGGNAAALSTNAGSSWAVEHSGVRDLMFQALGPAPIAPVVSRWGTQGVRMAPGQTRWGQTN